MWDIDEIAINVFNMWQSSDTRKKQAAYGGAVDSRRRPGSQA